MGYQRLHLLHILVGGAQALKDGVRQPDAFFYMAVETDALGHAKGARLAYVMQ
jgi:hypothetical protein